MDSWGEAAQLDRCEPQRLDADWLAASWTDPSALLLRVDRAGQLNVNDDLAIVERRPAGESNT